MAPIHHHFEMSGWKEVKIVIIFALVTALMCGLAWLGIDWTVLPQ
jgi:phospho-N-acetylmuramoyl-pentapeptide-transferase